MREIEPPSRLLRGNQVPEMGRVKGPAKQAKASSAISFPYASARHRPPVSRRAARPITRTCPRLRRPILFPTCQ